MHFSLSGACLCHKQRPAKLLFDVGARIKNRNGGERRLSWSILLVYGLQEVSIRLPTLFSGCLSMVEREIKGVIKFDAQTLAANKDAYSGLGCS